MAAIADAIPSRGASELRPKTKNYIVINIRQPGARAELGRARQARPSLARPSAQLDLIPAIASTSGRIHCELLRLLFLHAHRETTPFFEIFDDGHAQPHTSRFTYRRAAFFNTLKSKTGLMVARAAALRTNINIDGRPLPPKKRRRTSSKHCAPHILHASAPHFHLPVN